MNSPIGKNVSLCALKYGISEGDVVDLIRKFCSALHLWFATGDLRGRILPATGRCCTRGLAVAWFVRLCIIEEIIFFHY